MCLAQFAQQRWPVHFRHDDVGYDNIHLAAQFLHDFQRLDARSGFVDGIAARLERAHTAHAHGIFVFHQQDRG